MDTTYNKAIKNWGVTKGELAFQFLLCSQNEVLSSSDRRYSSDHRFAVPQIHISPTASAS